MVPMPDAGNCIFLTTVYSECCGGSPGGGIAGQPSQLETEAGCVSQAVRLHATDELMNNNRDINIPNGFPNDVAVHNAVGKVDVSLQPKHDRVIKCK